MSTALALGAACGFGVLLVVAGLRVRHPDLADALRGLDRSGVPTRSWIPRLGPSPAVSDLLLVERSAERHAVRKLTAAAALALIPPAAAALALLADVGSHPTLLLAVSFLLALVGFVTPDLEVRALAQARRAEFVHALSGFLDITAVLLAGGAGTESALLAAASLGESRPQQRLRHALDSCRLTGRTSWQALGELGERLEIDELEQLATSLQLAGEQGARVRTTLTERARALRTAQLAAAEAHARSLTEQMSVPVALLAVAFMLFVGFPAIWVVVGEL